ncbi:Exosome complex component RRP41-like [Vitis vinifera]|uniref:Exosome complex component RRP41-like n=1 Tax=Vitis vinifera TaxID=29760 RepID=A0A438JM80_VITVI|nr:Exosome complex component RRP41-like [Vitis vinifera]
MRQIRGEIGAVAKADGSAFFEMGNTKVIAAVYGPREGFGKDGETHSYWSENSRVNYKVENRSQQISDQALVRCEYTMANFSTGDRMRKPKGDRRSTEISLVIRQTMEACILTHLMPRSQIDIFVQVLQADGGTRSACINAATLALADAGIPMRDLVTSCSAGYLNSTPLLDLNYVEDSAGGPDVTVGILPKLDKVTLLQMDAKLPMDIFENVMQLAIEGCKAIANYIREVFDVKACVASMVICLVLIFSTSDLYMGIFLDSGIGGHYNCSFVLCNIFVKKINRNPQKQAPSDGSTCFYGKQKWEELLISTRDES